MKERWSDGENSQKEGNTCERIVYRLKVETLKLWLLRVIQGQEGQEVSYR